MDAVAIHPYVSKGMYLLIFSGIFKAQIFIVISPVFTSVSKGIVDKGKPAGPCNTLPVDESYLEPWHGQTNWPAISKLIRQPAWVHLFEKTFNEEVDFTTINLSNRKIPVPSLAALIRLTAVCSDNCLFLPAIVLHSTTNVAATPKVASLRNVLRFINLCWSNSFFINHQNYEDFLSWELTIILVKADMIIFFYVLWQFLLWVVIIYRNALIFIYIDFRYWI